MLKGCTMAEVYGPAMEIKTKAEADAYLQELIEHCMQLDSKKTKEEVLVSVRSNLGYYAGYYDTETRARVEALFECSHPYFGRIAHKGCPTTEEAFKMGQELGEKMKAKST